MPFTLGTYSRGEPDQLVMEVCHGVLNETIKLLEWNMLAIPLCNVTTYLIFLPRLVQHYKPF
jgi:hypothetical protein